MILINPPTKGEKILPRLALAYIGTISNSKIIDLNTMPNPVDRFLDYKTDVLGIFVQSKSYNQAQNIIKLYREKYPKSKIVSISGIIDIECCYPSLKLEENISFPQSFDDSLPFPDYELFDSFGVFKKKWQSGEWPYAILTSLGCPHQCIYCAGKNRQWRARSVENCYQELKQAKDKYGIKYFQILDDCFNFQSERVVEFCERIKDLNLSWFCSNGLRINKFDDNIAKTLHRSGCVGISFGIESIDSEVLEKIKKGITPESINQAVKIAKKYFGLINGFFIIGLPGSSYKKDLNSLHWALRAGINAHFSYYLPFDKYIPFDKNFYGEFSNPISDEYPKKLQKTIADLAEFMSIEFMGISEKNLILKTIYRIFKYDFFYLPFYLKAIVKKIINKLKIKLHENINFGSR